MSGEPKRDDARDEAIQVRAALTFLARHVPAGYGKDQEKLAFAVEQSIREAMLDLDRFIALRRAMP
jgi:hypothetical protein